MAVADKAHRPQRDNSRLRPARSIRIRVSGRTVGSRVSSCARAAVRSGSTVGAGTASAVETAASARPCRTARSSRRGTGTRGNHVGGEGVGRASEPSVHRPDRASGCVAAVAPDRPVGASAAASTVSAGPA